MHDCWASCLGNCEGGLSREHIVSKSLFVSPEISVSGFPWCKGETKTIGIESLVAKILCSNHNSMLSPLDSAAANAFDILRKQTKLSNDRGKRSSKTLLKIERFYIDAKLLERWFLKTLINLTYRGDSLIGTGGKKIGFPPKELVEICFGLASFPGSAGMYVAANKGMDWSSKDTVSFCPDGNDERIIGGFFTFRGVRFYLALSAVGMEVPLWQVPGIPLDWKDAKLLRPFKKIIAKHHGKRISHVIEFQW